jgi:seryl-tRNA synthetase
MIDYNLIQKSINFYEEYGFQRVESPWTVSEQVDNITRPVSAMPFKLNHNGKCLVASGEQSFLYMYLKGFLPRGEFQTVTPCFRFESFDFLHTKYFIKNELIKTDKVDQTELDMVVEIALRFYKKLIPKAEVVATEIGYDIEVNGKELGSYGIRECEFLKWIYATGCAEPRTSSLINLYGVS